MVSPPSQIVPVASGNASSSSRIDTLAVNQPLATKPPKILYLASWAPR
jgi:hypothetical protein